MHEKKYVSSVASGFEVLRSFRRWYVEERLENNPLALVPVEYEEELLSFVAFLDDSLVCAANNHPRQDSPEFEYMAAVYFIDEQFHGDLSLGCKCQPDWPDWFRLTPDAVLDGDLDGVDWFYTWRPVFENNDEC